ncbi:MULTISPECIES: hypothetical protein [Enterobacteriaceae]|uniref:hypothetical protein n=1 Tax=Enterobacteriaceae TaxID=543 RepID=UPI000643C2BB|nr:MULTISPECIES: hypothetical protein [Enterobacteriaceae]HAV1939095.1 hypothetical protein [Enterobacter hormaechei subsp. steigerwaltii]HAV2160129.1 hypothetical protein [Enterobacter cloacae]HDT5074286.1 hypothetical protein [Enterobacter asburiae]EGQ5301217.1 hypothetical protein [Enterobacter hormaechei]EHF4996260.1 hypothetical protein [Enterobacter hormaechei]
MPVTIQDIKEHRDHFGIGDITDMDIVEYKRLLNDGAFFWINHNEIIRHTLSEEYIAATPEQVDALIEQLKRYREKMRAAGK